MEKLNFEDLLSKLEEIVKKLEDKNIALDEAITLYQTGMELSKKLADMMAEAEKLIIEER